MTSGAGDLGATLCRRSLLNGRVALVALGPFGPPLLVEGARAASGASAEAAAPNVTSEAEAISTATPATGRSI